MTVKRFLAITALLVSCAAALAQPIDVPPADPGVPPVPQPAGQQPVEAHPPAPAPQAGLAQPTATMTPTPTPIVFENVPVKTLWDQYREAAKKITNKAPDGLEALLRVFSSEDEQWLRANTPLLIDLLSSGTIASSSTEEKKAFVAEALLRNMPRDITGLPKFYRPVGSAYGVALVTDSSSGRPVDYVTLVYQEAGRWVLYHPFFARDFVWLPQLAAYKKHKGLPNSPDEVEYLKNGFAPFTQWARSFFTYCGYSPGEDTRGKPTAPTGATSR
ncbi:MAG: hypothetical protein ACP5QZ_05165 [Candidatus Sumerlaeaceae bacterium]